MGHAQSLAVAGLVWFACIGESRGDSFTLDLTTTSRPQFPIWMPERPLAAPKHQAELSFAVVPGPDDDDLALTVVFQEEVGGFLSVYWEDSSGNRALLAPNLFENIGLPNQRTLLIKRPTMGGPGKVILKSSQEVLNVLRVRLDWARPGVARLVDNVPNGALVTTGGKMYAPEEVDGSTLTPIADSWEGKILTTSLTDKAERIENGIDYSVAIPDKVQRARIELLVNGLQLDQFIILWLNGQACGPIALEIPDLTDPGYDKVSSGIAHFIGWRKGMFLLQGEQLIVGENHFQFQTPPNSQIAIRDFLLQVEYAPN
ncbi:MAG TPA: hypothetical protein VGY91_07745 [Chthoniobacterales bacterium]|jgi:hypothetical protein|nr:hypothetical protein [Chthoniobacterales bacterium]